MTATERAESMLATHVDLRPPWDKPWKLRAFELVLSSLPEIAAYEELGLDAVRDINRRRLVGRYVGKRNGEPYAHYAWNVWLLDKCIGAKPMSGDDIFLRCLSCHKIRTSAGMNRGACKCGSNRLSNAVGQMDTRRALGYLASGY